MIIVYIITTPVVLTQHKFKQYEIYLRRSVAFLHFKPEFYSSLCTWFIKTLKKCLSKCKWCMVISEQICSCRANFVSSLSQSTEVWRNTLKTCTHPSLSLPYAPNVAATFPTKRILKRIICDIRRQLQKQLRLWKTLQKFKFRIKVSSLFYIFVWYIVLSGKKYNEILI